MAAFYKTLVQKQSKLKTLIYFYNWQKLTKKLKLWINAIQSCLMSILKTFLFNIKDPCKTKSTHAATYSTKILEEATPYARSTTINNKKQIYFFVEEE